jgi:hypothetical protein
MDKRKSADAFQLAKRMSRPLDRLHWMLEFARLKFEAVAALEGAELAALQDAVNAFVTAQLGRPPFATMQIRRLTREDLWNLRSRLYVRIEAFIGSPDSPAGWRDPGLPRRLTRDKTGALRVIPDSGDIDGIFLGCAFALAVAEGARIVKCARHNCNNVLVRRGRSTYCSKRCSQYVRTMKYRHSKQAPERTEWNNG